MIILRSAFIFGLIFSTFGYAVDINLDTTVILDDFSDSYGDSPKQNSLAAIYGIKSFNNQPWKGGGFWYTVCTNPKDLSFGVYAPVRETPDGEITALRHIDSSNDSLMFHDSTLDVMLSAISDTASNPFAGISCELIGSGTKSLDLSKMDTVEILARSYQGPDIESPDTVRVAFETEDYLQANFTWGHYGCNLPLSSDWQLFKIPVDNLKPDDWSDALGAGWTWNHGKNSVIRINFSVKNQKDAYLQIGSIAFKGMTYKDFNFGTTADRPAIFSKASNNSNLRINGSTVSFKIPKTEKITLSLFNPMGGKVCDLFKGESASGEFVLNKKVLSQGVYQIKMHGENINQAVKLFVIK